MEKRREKEGWMKIRLLLDEKRTNKKVDVIESEPPGVFDNSVIRSASSWRFTPGTVNGVPVKTLVETKMRFELDK